MENKERIHKEEIYSGTSPQSCTPYSQEAVTICKAEYIQLKVDARSYKTAHSRSVKREEVLKEQVRNLKAQIVDLKHRLFGKKAEKNAINKKNEGQSKDPKEKNPRGQRKGTQGHGRVLLTNLPVIEEEVPLTGTQSQCPKCGKETIDSGKTEDSEVLEVEVRAYRRRYRRKQSFSSCNCGVLPGIITAPIPNRLIPKGKLGISVWVMLLLNKYLYSIPTYRSLEIFKNYDLEIPQGTVTGGLQKLMPLFSPVVEAIKDHILNGSHWHADETRWKVFAEVEGKTGNAWMLWMYRSSSAVVFDLDPFRTSEVPKRFFGDNAKGILVCDRFSGYKKLSKDIPGIVLAFCWAHVRRDFLELGRTRPKLNDWALDWVERIGTLYHLNSLRLKAQVQNKGFAAKDNALRKEVAKLLNLRDEDIKDKNLAEEARAIVNSLKNHWEGLTIFVEKPEIPMDNNLAENAVRTPCVGRKNFYGSGSVWSGKFSALMYSVLMTLKYSKINPHVWLTSYLKCCAENDNQAPKDLNRFLPWLMNKDQLNKFKLGSLSPPLPS